ncbi:MAG TPA: hypothetical protein VHP64_01375, partial [Candidatus Limnocylindria bacterium]|nr:hypothetical protein [Candidatus Limnocylindria bacterium]
FMQSLIREVAYGTLARRDRRARHLAVARHYEATGDDEMAGALASHYVAAHAASDAGDEADAVAAQARLALVAAAQRAAALGAHQQAIAHVEQALTITTDPRERAPLLDRAAISAAATATPEAQRYAQAAIDAYREVGEERAAVAATVRFGRVLLYASEIQRAAEVLTRAIVEAEELDDQALVAAGAANLSRAYMRLGWSTKAIEAADRALAIAELRNLEEIAAEALVNKGAALAQLGRRRESTALHAAAFELSLRLDDRQFELRARNNYATVLREDDPPRASRMMEEATALARDIGDRAMYIWLIGNVSADAWVEGGDWDQALELLAEASEWAAITNDRIRLRTHIALIESHRGERLHEAVEELQAMVGDREDPEAIFPLLMIQSQCALSLGDSDAAYRFAMEARTVDVPEPDIPIIAAMRAAIVGRNADRILELSRLFEKLPGSGALTLAIRRHARAAVAAVEGRVAEAVADFRGAYATMMELGRRYDAALMAVEATILLGPHAELRPIATEARSTLESVRARVFLDYLDAALAAEPAAISPAELRSQVPAE